MNGDSVKINRLFWKPSSIVSTIHTGYLSLTEIIIDVSISGHMSLYWGTFDLLNEGCLQIRRQSPYWGLSYTVYKVNFIFFSNSVPFNRQSYQKQKGSGNSDQSLFRSQNKFKNIPLFVIYYLTKFDDVM